MFKIIATVPNSNKRKTVFKSPDMKNAVAICRKLNSLNKANNHGVVYYTKPIGE